MDPLSIIAGTTGTVAFCITSAIMLNDFISSILDAPADIAAIAQDVDALTKILYTLQGWLEKDVIRPSAARSLSGSLNTCVTSMNQLRLAIQPYTKVNANDRGTLKWRSFGWMLKKQEIRDLREKLQHSKATLSLSIGIINTYAIESGNQELSKQIESGNEAIRNDLSNLQQDIRSRKERKLDLASLGGDHGSLFNGTDAGMPLRRYLEDLSPLSHPWAGASEIGEILSLRSLQVKIRFSMDDGDSRPPTRPASPSIIVEEPHSLPRIISPLHRATEEDDIRKVMELLAAGADINEKAWDGRTPLHVCAQTNNTVMAEVLLYKSATINVVDDAGKEPLRTALDTGSTEVACMLLSRGGSLEALSGFIVDVAQREHMSEKRLILRCFGCVADEGKEDELLDLLSTSTHGAPVSLENALMEILHEAESSYMSETVGLAKSFSDRKAKLPVTSSEPKREVDRESDLDIQAVHAQANVRSVEDSGESKHLQGVEPLAKPDEKRIRSVEVALAENPENDASSASARPGTSVPTTSKGATCDDGIPKLLDHWAPTKTTVYGVDEFYGMDDLGDSMAHQEIVPVSAQMAEPSKGLESLACDTQAISQPISNIETPDIDALSGVKTTSSDNVPFKPVFHKQFSWEVAVSDDATSASAAEQVDSEQATELYWATPQSPPPCLPSGHLFGIPLQDLCDHQEVPVPRIVLDCISILEQSASDLSGIYQHPPEPILVDKLRDFMETGSQLREYPDTWLQAHRAAVLGLLKQFLRELPDSLLPYAHHDDLMELAQEPKLVCLPQLKAIIYALPVSHYATLRVIMLHLKKVIDHQRQAAQKKSSRTPGLDAVYLTSREIEEMFAPLLIHPAKTTRWTGTNSASRAVIVSLILNECLEFLHDEKNELNVLPDSRQATRPSVRFPKF